MARGGKRRRPRTPHNYDLAWARTELEIVNARRINQRKLPVTAAQHLAHLAATGGSRLELRAFATLAVVEDVE
jgi:hypothetical protein